MIKVLELIDGGFLGGGQIHILYIAENINNAEFDVTVAAKGGKKFELVVARAGVPFKDLYMPKLLRKKYLNPLIDFCKQERFDIVHSHGGVAGFYGRMLKKNLPDIKNVHSIHGIHYVNSNNLLRRFTSEAVEQYLLKYTDMTICETQSDFEKAVSLRIADRNKSVVINNGINISKYSENKTKSDLLYLKFELSGMNFVIGNISRFDEQKNQKLILKAAARLLKKHPEMKFVFVGDGDELLYAQKLSKHYNIDNNIYFEGERENLLDYYSVFDIFVFPTFWEGMPYVLLEAMASGIPIICSDIPNHREVLDDGNCALLINPKDCDELSGKIMELYQNKDLRNSLSQKALERVKSFNEKIMVNKIENVYKEVMAN
jgi:glycosyltransferase involved in cell wall biosynthesis